MRKKIERIVDECAEEAVRNSSEVIESNDASLISNSICLLSCSRKREAEALFEDFGQRMKERPNQKVLSHYLLSAKELGYNSKDMEEAIERIESERCGGKWSDQVWLNSLVLKALGRFDITYPGMEEYLTDHRLSNGSWFEKVWVTSYALEGLFYSFADPSELTPSADYLKSAMKVDHWSEEERGKMGECKVTSRALQSLLLIGEGYEEEPLSSAIQWSIERIQETDDLYRAITLSIPLAFIIKGRAEKKTSYRRSSAVEFKETKVEIGEQVMGDKVKEKVGTKVKDSAVVRSNIGNGEDAEVEDSVALRSDIGEGTEVEDSVVMRSNVGGDGEKQNSIIRRIAEEEFIDFKYSVFTGEEIDGQVKFCPKCGTEVQEGWKHCPGCGYDMREIREIFG